MHLSVCARDCLLVYCSTIVWLTVQVVPNTPLNCAFAFICKLWRWKFKISDYISLRFLQDPRCQNWRTRLMTSSAPVNTPSKLTLLVLALVVVWSIKSSRALQVSSRQPHLPPSRRHSHCNWADTPSVLNTVTIVAPRWYRLCLIHWTPAMSIKTDTG